jgi:hypothetical protein
LKVVTYPRAWYLAEPVVHEVTSPYYPRTLFWEPLAGLLDRTL